MNATLCMRSLSYHKTTPIFRFFALTSVVLLLFTLFSNVLTARALTDRSTNGSRLITIHDRGQDRGLMTNATSLRDAFKEANIPLDKNDLVEPGLDEQLVANNYEVNVYRARPVMIVDGAVRQKVMSPYQTAEQITKNAGVTLHDEDTTTISRSEDIVTDGSGLRLTIDRATALTLVLYGKKIDAYTQSTTVGDMMAKKSISLGKDDTLSVPATTPIIAGMNVEIWRNGKQTVTEEKVIAFDTDKIQDADRDLGYREVKTAGENGKKNVTYEIEMRNGTEVGRVEIQSVVTQEAKKQVEVVGAKAKSFGGSCSEWMAAAGITDLNNANYLIGKESGCNPYSVNKSSGACGVGQALPCSKTGCAMGDGACQTIWMNSYVMGRYGSWAAAANHHRQFGWY